MPTSLILWTRSGLRPWWFPLRKNPQSGVHCFRWVRAFSFLVALGFFLLLQRLHMRISALLFQKLAIGAALYDAAVVHHQNQVGIDYVDSRWAMVSVVRLAAMRRSSA
jgi:hypothetical protein